MSAMPLQPFTDCPKHGDWVVVRGELWTTYNVPLDKVFSLEPPEKEGNGASPCIFICVKPNRTGQSIGLASLPQATVPRPDQLQAKKTKKQGPHARRCCPRTEDISDELARFENKNWNYTKELKLQEAARKRDTQLTDILKDFFCCVHKRCIPKVLRNYCTQTGVA